MLDLTQRPLTSYLASPPYATVLRGFFDIASDVISKVNREAMTEFDLIVPFVRDLLRDNADSIAAAADSNLIQSQFRLWGRRFSHSAVDELETAQLKELGTLIVATYDTTALSILWAIAYLERSPQQRERVIAEVRGSVTAVGPSAVDLAVLEALRLGGSNPTALWRRTVRPVTLHHRGRAVTVPEGTMMWLDRRRANQDPTVFPSADEFDLANARVLYRSHRDTLSSVLSRSRYEINSFSMVNTERNPRKCPARLFSVRLQALLLSELYGRYDVSSHGIDLNLARHSSMPRPAHPGVIRITPCRAPSGANPAHDQGAVT